MLVQFGGQTAINLASHLAYYNAPILGTSMEGIDAAEDRRRFESLLKGLRIPQSQGKTVMAADEAVAVAEELGYPVLVRPSYVLGGRAMEVVENTQDLVGYMASAVKVSSKHPVLIDKYIKGKEVEVDAVCDGRQTLIPAIIEHIERAGVHSGDSTAVIPAQTLTAGEAQPDRELHHAYRRSPADQGIVEYPVRDRQRPGLLPGGQSQGVPHRAGTQQGDRHPPGQTGYPDHAGSTLADLGYGAGLAPPPPFVAVKAPVFSFEKLTRVDVSLGPEMKSTGEVLGIDPDYGMALYKALLAAGINVPLGGRVLVSLAERDRAEAIPILAGYAELGFEILATTETARELREKGIDHRVVVSTGETGQGRPVQGRPGPNALT